MMMPLQVTLLPNYIGLRDMGLLDNRLAVIVPMIFMPFGVIVLHQYMKSINFNLIEAIQLETNSVIKILSAAVIPQLKPCIIAVSVYTFADCWNMVEQPMVFLSDINKKTLSLFFTRTTDYNATVFFPAVVIYLLPVFLIFLCSNKSLESGLAFGELHG